MNLADHTCTCSGPGPCEKWGITVTRRIYELCSGNCPIERPCPEIIRSKFLDQLKTRPSKAGLRFTIRGTPPNGPGEELKLLLASIGLTSKGGCGCNEMANQMNSWGIEGCNAPENREKIIGWLRSKSQELGWTEKIKAGIKALGQGLLLDPLDPSPGLLAEAICRAEAKEVEKVKGTNQEENR